MATKNGRWWLTQDSQEMVIGSTPERIYDLVSDMPRMGEWSPSASEWSGATESPVPPRVPPSSATTGAAPPAS